MRLLLLYICVACLPICSVAEELMSGEAILSVRKNGLSLKVKNTEYQVLNSPHTVTLEVNVMTLNGDYSEIIREENELICLSELRSENGTVFSVRDVFAPDIADHFRMDREVSVKAIGAKDEYFNSYFGLTSKENKTINDFEFFVPGIWYKDNKCLKEGFLASDYSDNYFYFREDRLPLPVVSAREKASGLAIDLIHLNANPETFYGENGQDRIVDDRMQFGSLGFTETDKNTILFVFPGIEGEKNYIAGRRDRRTDYFAYRSHPVKVGVRHAYSLAFGFNQIDNFPSLVETVWKQAWNKYNPPVHKADVRDAYNASMEVLDNYLENVNGAPGFPFSVYLPNGIARAYNYQMGFIGFQISNAAFLLRKGLESKNKDYVRRASEVIDFWVNNSPTETGLPKAWADAYVDRKPAWRAYQSYMRVIGGGMEGVMGAWSIMKKHGVNRADWLNYGKQCADWLVRNQESDGSFFIRYRWETGKPDGDSKYTTTNVIRFLIEMYKATNNKKYLKTALKAGKFSYDFIHNDYLYVGGVIDNPNVKDRESGQMAIYAFLCLYDVTGDNKWKEAAVQAARYTETFMFSYKVPMAVNDTLTDFPKHRDVIGQTVIATGHSGIDNGLAFSSFQYYRLYLLTGDAHFLHVARVIQNNTLQIMDLDGKMGYKYRGLLTECFSPQSNRGHSVRQQLPWDQAAILDPMHRFMDAFDEWDIDVIEQWPMAKRMQMINKYALTQGMTSK